MNVSKMPNHCVKNVTLISKADFPYFLHFDIGSEFSSHDSYGINKGHMHFFDCKSKMNSYIIKRYI